MSDDWDGKTCPRGCGRTDVFMWVTQDRGPPICGACANVESRARAAALKVTGRMTLPLVPRLQTTVGHFTKSFPAKSGNCGTLLTDEENRRDAPSAQHRWCRNMSAENMDEITRRVPALAEGVACDVLEDGSVRVVDERVPAEWRRHVCPTHGFWEDGS